MNTHEWRGRLDRAAGWLDASPSELMGAAVLVLGSVAATLAFWWTGLPRPGAEELVPLPATSEAHAHDHEHGPAVLVVHVAGAVHTPGVLEVPDGARVHDALEAAGGALPDAALHTLNLARPVSDGELIVVPLVGEEAGIGPAAGTGAHRPDGTLDLNRATEAELQELPGVGPVLARRIIEYRDAHGPFTEKGQLREVSGIGERVFQSLADLISV